MDRERRVDWNYFNHIAIILNRTVHEGLLLVLKTTCPINVRFGEERKWRGLAAMSEFDLACVKTHLVI